MILAAKTIVTGDGKTVLTDSAVLVQNGKISEIGNAEEMKKNHPDETVKDYADATILPGLIDMHIHLGGSWRHRPDAMYFDDHLISYFALAAAQNAFGVGVTTLRDVGSEHLLCEKMRYAGKQGFVEIPRLIHTDNPISMTNGHADIITYLSGNTYSHPGQNIGIVDGELEIRKVIRTVIRDGADWVKVCTSHRTETPEYTIEELRAAVDESHRLGKKCAVHAGIEPGISMSIEAGFDTIEHGTFLTVEQAEKMKEHGQVWVPTIIAYTYAYEMVKKEIEASGKINSAVLAKGMGRVKYFEDAAFAYRDNFKKLYDTGVKIVAGTDVVVYGAPPAPVALELAYMVQYGITPVQAIQIGTSNSAEVLEMDHQIGMIREGLQADICICNGNAAEDIQKLQQVREVYLGGKSVFLERKAYL